MKLTEYALKFKTTVYVLILLIIVVGINSYRALPVENAPDIQIPIILVQTLYPGVAPQDMEKLVTNILERELKDLSDVKEMTSTSSESVSIVQIEFETEVDLDEARQRVRDKVDMAKPDLPADAEDPVLIEINISDFPIMLVNVSADYDPIRLKQVAEDVEDRIEEIPGVLGVDLVGGIEREIQIYLNPERMRYYSIGVGQVIGRIQEEHRTTPAGNLDLGGSKYSVRIPGEYRDVSRMEDIVIKAPQGQPIKLRDIGRVIDGIKERETISRSNGTECITLRIKKRSGENVVRIADAVNALVKELGPTLPEGTQLSIRQDQSKYIRDMVSDLENSIISGLLLVLIVLFFAMGLRNASFVALAIPLSMLITFAVLRIMDVTLNTVVLFALILALGMLVDNSIVVIENIFRHASDGTPRQQAALSATMEVAWPIIASTSTTVVVFAPMLFWPGVMGEFMSYLPLTVIIALLASLFIAMVVNPVVAANFLNPKGAKLFDDSGEARGGILSRYQTVLSWSLDHPKTLVAISNLLLVASIVLYGIFGAGIEFFPESTPERAQVKITAPQGTAIERTDSYLKKAEALAQGMDNSKDVVASAGTAGGDFYIGGSGGGSSHLAVVDLEFKDRHERTHSTWDTIKDLRAAMTDFTGAEYRVEIQKNGPPTGEPVGVEISGKNYQKLSEYAREVKEIVRQIPGVVDLKDDYEGGKPEVRIEVDREQAMLRKVNTTTISNAVRAAINGIEASVLREGDEEYDIVVRYDEAFRQSINDILNIEVTGKDDVQIPLRDVAKVTTSGGLGSIKHIDQKRTVLVSGDVSGRSSSEVMIDVERAVKEQLSLPDGYTVGFSGETEEQDKAAAFLSEAFLIGLFLILMILITQFNSVMRPAIILGSVVMSLIGVFFGLIITQNKFGIIMTGMGVISLAGVVVNNAIVLIDYVDQLRNKWGLPLRDALMRAGMVRFRPVLLTAITTILGMTPMALGVSIDFTTFSLDTGSSTVEWWGPMARAIIFGLAFATMLTLVMVPVMYLVQVQMFQWAKRKYQALASRFGLAQSNEQEME